MNPFFPVAPFKSKNKQTMNNDRPTPTIASVSGRIALKLAALRAPLLKSISSAPLLLALAALAGAASLQAASAPPALMTYQGFLADQNGDPLAQTQPANHEVVFKIFDDLSGGNLIWLEKQTVTVDKGQFSVLLGQGNEVSGQPRPPLGEVFASSSASDRYLELTVTIGADPVTIAPRLRLVTSPYSFLAESATKLVSPAGAPLASTESGSLTVNNGLNVTGALAASGAVTAATFNGSGAGLTGIPASALNGIPAAKIDSGVLDSARIPNLDASKITSGTLANDRVPHKDALYDSTGHRMLGVGTEGTYIANYANSEIYAQFNRDFGGLFIYLSNVDKHIYWLSEGGGAGGWGLSSDRRLKHDIVDVEDVLERAMKVQIRRFRWRDGKPEASPEMGVIAQEVQPLFPDLVSRNKASEKCPDGTLGVAYTGFGLISLKALQELKAEKDAEIAGLRKENEALRSQVEELSQVAARQASLEKQVADMRELVLKALGGTSPAGKAAAQAEAPEKNAAAGIETASK